MRNRDPCGDASSLTPATVANNEGIGRIELPVLLLFGRADPIYEQSAPAAQARAYSGSSDVTLREYDDASHALTLERPAAQIRADVATWLRDRRLVSTSPPGCDPARARVAAARRAVHRARDKAKRTGAGPARRRANARLARARRTLAKRRAARDRACLGLSAR